MKPTEKDLEDLIGQIIELTWSYAIWWELANIKNREAYRKAMEAFPNYFRAVFHSMQQGICVIVVQVAVVNAASPAVDGEADKVPTLHVPRSPTAIDSTGMPEQVRLYARWITPRGLTSPWTAAQDVVVA